MNVEIRNQAVLAQFPGITIFKLKLVLFLYTLYCLGFFFLQRRTKTKTEQRGEEKTAQGWGKRPTYMGKKIKNKKDGPTQ